MSELIRFEDFFDNNIVKDVKAIDTALDKILETQRKVKEVAKNNAATNEQVRKANKSVSDSVKKLTEEEKRLLAIQRQSDRTTLKTVKAQEDLRKKRKQLTDQIKEQNTETKKNQSFTQKMTGAFRLAVFQITAAIAAFKGAIEATKAYIKLSNEVNSQTKQTGILFNLNTKEARELTTEIRKLSAAYGQEFSDVLKSANIISKEFGITGNEAVNLIKEGFEKGANINGEFLELLKEYPAQLKSVGLNAEQTIAIITQTEREGVFSDKGIDAIKEAGIRLREMTPATQSALNAIGLSASTIQSELRDGSKSLFDVVQQVSTQLNTLPENSTEVGAAIADIFGGPGEDAGLRFLGTLGNINTDLSSISSTLSESELSTIRYKEAVEELKIQFVGNGRAITTLKNSLTEFIVSLTEGIRKIREEGGLLAAGFAALGQGIITPFKLFKEIIQTSVIEPIRLAVQVIDSLINKDLSGVKDALKDFFENVKQNGVDVKDIYVDAGKKIIDAYKGAGKEAVEIQDEANSQLKTLLEDQVSDFEEVEKKKTQTAREAVDERRRIEEQNAILDKIRRGEDFKEFSDNLDLELEEFNEFLDKKTDLELTAIEDRLNKELELEKKAAEEKLAIADELAKKKKNLEDDLDDKIEQLQQESANVALSISDAFFENKLAAFESQQEAEKEILKNRLDKNLISEKDYNDKIDKLNKKTALEQAKAERKKALFQVGVDTALAAVKSISKFPLPAGLPNLIATLAIGAAQTAAIATRPLPAFRHGGIMPYTGFARVSEEGPERVDYKGGSFLTPAKESVIALPKGAEITPHKETVKEIERGDVKIVDNRPVHKHEFTNMGYSYMVYKSNSTIKKVNKKFRGIQ